MILVFGFVALALRPLQLSGGFVHRLPFQTYRHITQAFIALSFAGMLSGTTGNGIGRGGIAVAPVSFSGFPISCPRQDSARQFLPDYLNVAEQSLKQSAA